ncbi:hypothetical protein LCGC14_0267700 [marine sediment metagenome]|uniref:Uncharacterized protein n=1 Tax=marine sediment metagenome TaxID=412755 RepID=A0A0F9U4Q1_9ZZZZ
MAYSPYYDYEAAADDSPLIESCSAYYDECQSLFVAKCVQCLDYYCDDHMFKHMLSRCPNKRTHYMLRTYTGDKHRKRIMAELTKRGKNELIDDFR